MAEFNIRDKLFPGWPGGWVAGWVAGWPGGWMDQIEILQSQHQLSLKLSLAKIRFSQHLTFWPFFYILVKYMVGDIYRYTCFHSYWLNLCAAFLLINSSSIYKLIVPANKDFDTKSGKNIFVMIIFGIKIIFWIKTIY